LDGVERLRRISAGGTVVGLVVARKKKGKNSKKEGLGSGFIGEHHTVEERERESRCGAMLRSTGGAVVHLGHAWWPLSTDDPAWQGEREPAEAARAVGGVTRRHVARERERRWDSRASGEQPVRAAGRHREETEEPGLEEEDED
jgi:hypothetical protein